MVSTKGTVPNASVLLEQSFPEDGKYNQDYGGDAIDCPANNLKFLIP